jgi:hypothetical protein
MRKRGSGIRVPVVLSTDHAPAPSTIITHLRPDSVLQPGIPYCVQNIVFVPYIREPTIIKCYISHYLSM